MIDTTDTTVLIIVCPCALGLVTPMSIIAGVGRAAELGVLQRASRIDTLVLDKTSRLMAGKPQLDEVLTWHGWSRDAVVQAAAVLE